MTVSPMTSVNEPPVLVIKPKNDWFQVQLDELWHSRELLYFLTWRDVTIKYKQSLLGIMWAVIVPVMQMLVFGIIFGKFGNLPTNGINPFLFYLSGLVPWQYLANALSVSSQSMVGQSALLTKIYLPRLFIPLSGCLASMVDTAIGFVLLLVVMLFFGIVPAFTTLLIPFLFLIALAVTCGVSFYFSALNVKYRDIKFVIPFLIQIWMYATVIVPYNKIPEGIWQYLYALNPMAAFVEGCRWLLMHHQLFMDAEKTVPLPFPWLLIAIGAPVSLAVLLFGTFYFKRMENMFADIV